jgi:DNA-binding transcriptional LysR family regulator
MDKLSAMQAFARVAEMGSFTRAADALGISRTMATVHVARLEDHLGVRLLNRTTRRVSLTEAGSAYSERCAALLAEIVSVESSLAEMAEKPAGVVKISAPVSFGVLHLGSALAEFVERHPAVKLDVNLNDRTVDLVEEGYDLAIRIARLVDSTLVARRLASTSICVCASPAYVRRHGAPKVPRDLIRHACLGYAYSGTGDKWTFEGKDGVNEVRVRTESRANNGDLLREMAIHGQGIALLPSFIVADDLKARRLVALLPGFVGPKAGIFAIYPSRKYLSAKVRALVDFLAAHFARRHFEKAWVLFR